MVNKPQSETEKRSIGGLTEMLYEAVGGKGSGDIYVTHITADDGKEYRGQASTPEKSEERASRAYDRGENNK